MGEIEGTGRFTGLPPLGPIVNVQASMCGAFDIVLVQLAQSLTFTGKGRTMHLWHRLKIEGPGESIVCFSSLSWNCSNSCAFGGFPSPFCPSSRAVELGGVDNRRLEVVADGLPFATGSDADSKDGAVASRRLLMPRKRDRKQGGIHSRA